MSNPQELTTRKKYKLLGEDPSHYDGDTPSTEQGLNVTNAHNDLVSVQATARRKLDEYLMNKGKANAITG